MKKTRIILILKMEKFVLIPKIRIQQWKFNIFNYRERFHLNIDTLRVKKEAETHVLKIMVVRMMH